MEQMLSLISFTVAYPIVLSPSPMATSANIPDPFCIPFSSQWHARIANLRGCMVFCAAQAVCQIFCFAGLRAIEQLIRGIKHPAPMSAYTKKTTPNLQFLEYPLLNPEPQSTDYAMDFWRCHWWELLLRVAPWMCSSLCVCLHLCLSLWVFSLSP